MPILPFFMIKRSPSRRGATLLEVLLAALLLAAVAMVVTSVLSQINLAAQNRALRLHAYEVANRVILQYVDDPKVLKPTDVYDDGTYLFRWDIDERPVSIDEPVNSATQKPERQQAQATLDQTIVIDVRVYEAVPDGLGGPLFGREVARLTRPYNPLALTNMGPDKLKRLEKDPAFLSEIVGMLSGNATRQPRVIRDPGAPGARPAPSGGSGNGGGSR